MTTATTQFQAGKTYFGRFIGDADSIIKLEVVRRTPATIRTASGKTLRVKLYNGVEYVNPLGVYSMAPSVTADRVLAA